jgi:competence protein ComEA
MHVIGYLAAGIVVVVLGALWVRGGAGAGVARAGAGGSATGGAAIRIQGQHRAGGHIVVHVAGAVRRPGVYRLRAGMRVAGAIRRAGGGTAQADLDALNLAAKLDDGRQVLVPQRAGAGGAVAGGAAAAGGAAQPPVNLNTATTEQLTTLDGIGPSMAAKIVAYRQEQGGFGSVDELDQVSGIGPKRLEALRERVTV